MSFETLLGDEAIALGAIHAGMSSAFAYPGTPSTEVMEYFRARKDVPESFVAEWCANEKTAYESALGASFAGRRAIVSMKHVGLNVAADPFVNSALIRINGGLVVVVADDPGMHSSQDEQDSRAFAAFARMPCFEPADQQEAYDMTREAFDFSERHEVPVLMRITTRLAHSMAVIETRAGRAPNPVSKAKDTKSWILMPSTARVRWKGLLEKQKIFAAEFGAAAPLSLKGRKLGILTCGIGLQYYKENLEDYTALTGEEPSHLHIARYPVPAEKIRELAAHVGRLLVIEEGYPLVEDQVRGIFGAPVPVMGKATGELPTTGELSPDLVRSALGLEIRTGMSVPDLVPKPRPPQLCQGCPHADSFNALAAAIVDFPIHMVTSDIGCYTLGVLEPYNMGESCVEMGSSIGMARGASASGLQPTIAVIGDSTFYHSGLTNLLDAIAHGNNLTVLILDNGTTGMTGAQPTIVPSSNLEPVLRGIGVHPDHIRVLRAHRNNHAENVAVINEEIAFRGVSVVIMVRECIEYLKKERKA